MPRQRPTQHLGETGPLDLNQDDLLKEYMVSVLQNRLFIKPPSWTAMRDSIELLSIENDRELRASARQQRQLTQHSKRQALINKHRIDDLHKLQAELRNRFIETNTFIKDCDDKRIQAQQTVLAEKQTHKNLKSFIRETKQNVDSLLEFRGHLLKTVKDLEPYEAVMHEAINKFDIWNSVQDCTDRCDALMMTQVELTKGKEEAISNIQDIRLKFIKLSQEAAAMALALNTTLIIIEREYDNVKFEVLEWERVLVRIKNELVAEEARQIFMLEEIFNMYRLLCKRRGFKPTIPKTAVERQMNFIRSEIQIMKEVSKFCLNEEDT